MSMHHKINHLSPSFSVITNILKSNSLKLTNYANLVVEELIFNIVSHSNATEPINLSVVQSDKSIIIEIVDNGIEFNPVAESSKKDLKHEFDCYGLKIAKTIVSRWIYERRNNKNCLSVLLEKNKLEAI